MKFIPFSLAVIAALTCFAGCASIPSTDYHAGIAAASGVAQSIIFDARGSPTDVAGEVATALTMDEAVRQSLTNSPQVQAAIARVHIALADAKQSRLIPNPVLSVVFRFPEGGGKPIVDAGLTADLVTVLQGPRRASAADNRLRAASADLLTVVLDLVAEVQNHYVALQALEAEMSVLVERSKLIHRLVDLSKARLDKGEGTQLDVTTLEAQQVELETEEAESQLEQREERLTLARLMGRPSGSIDWQLTQWQSPARNLIKESEWIAIATNRRPEIQVRLWELAALGDETANTGLSLFDGTEIGAAAERDPDWSVGPAVAVPIPLFDWGQARREKSDAQTIEVRHNLTQIRRQIVEEVRRAYASSISNDATLEKVQSQLIPLQERRRRQAESAYLAGVTDITGLLVAEQDFQASRTKLVELQRKTSEAYIRLQRSVGGVDAMKTVSTTRPIARNPSTTQPTE